MFSFPCFVTFVEKINRYSVLIFKIQLNFTYIALAPRIFIHPADRSTVAPFGAEFTCSAEGCDVIWHRYNNSLPKKAYSALVTSVNEITSTLTIPNVTSEDAGKYYCMVWANMTATRSRVANLFLTGKECILCLIALSQHMIFLS